MIISIIQYLFFIYNNNSEKCRLVFLQYNVQSYFNILYNIK